MNPFLSIWYAPRRTIRHILDTHPTRHVLWLAGLAGLFRVIDRFSTQGFGDLFPLGTILLLSVFLGPIAGLISMFIFSALFQLIGSRLGGKASGEEMRAVVAWTSLPDILLLLIYIPLIGVFGIDFFKSGNAWAASITAAWVMGIVGIVGVILLVWRLGLTVLGVAEAHRFAPWKGLATVVLTGLFLAGIFGLVYLTRLILGR